MCSSDEAMVRLLDYDGRRYRLVNGWSILFRVRRTTVTTGRPNGIKYAFTLHDAAGHRLLGFDNAHGVPRAEKFDHRHRFRRTAELVVYEFRGADELICDFFDAVERACLFEKVAFAFLPDATVLEDDDSGVSQ
jgi:hypothetical protein